jgi:hypothetical protein
MKERRFLYFALGVAAVVSVGAVTNQVVSSPGALGLSDDGIRFPDGTVQTTAPMDLGSAARSSFRYMCFAQMLEGQEGASCSFPVVPGGKIAVVEYFDGRVRVESGQAARMWLEGAVYGDVYLGYQYTDTSLANDHWVVSEAHRMYLDVEGIALQVHVARNSSAGDAYFEAWITGYLVDTTP